MRTHRMVTLALGGLSITALVVGIAAATWRVPITPSGLWPSDHVGLVAQLQIPLSPGDQ